MAGIGARTTTAGVATRVGSPTHRQGLVKRRRGNAARATGLHRAYVAGSVDEHHHARRSAQLLVLPCVDDRAPADLGKCDTNWDLRRVDRNGVRWVVVDLNVELLLVSLGAVVRLHAGVGVVHTRASVAHTHTDHVQLRQPAPAAPGNLNEPRQPSQPRYSGPGRGCRTHLALLSAAYAVNVNASTSVPPVSKTCVCVMPARFTYGMHPSYDISSNERGVGCLGHAPTCQGTAPNTACRG